MTRKKFNTESLTPDYVGMIGMEQDGVRLLIDTESDIEVTVFDDPAYRVAIHALKGTRVVYDAHQLELIGGGNEMDGITRLVDEISGIHESGKSLQQGDIKPLHPQLLTVESRPFTEALEIKKID